jgi:hypothetical protein
MISTSIGEKSSETRLNINSKTQVPRPLLSPEVAENVSNVTHATRLTLRTVGLAMDGMWDVVRLATRFSLSAASGLLSVSPRQIMPQSPTEQPLCLGNSRSTDPYVLSTLSLILNLFFREIVQTLIPSETGYVHRAVSLGERMIMMAIDLSSWLTSYTLDSCDEFFRIIDGYSNIYKILYIN